MSTEPVNVGRDPAAVVEALRRLVEVAIAEDTALINRAGGWPDEVRVSDAAILHPVSFACQYGAKALVARLSALIGAEAAEAQFSALIAEQHALPGVREAHDRVERTSGKPAPSTLRSVH